MTARELIEEGVDVERGAANVAKILATHEPLIGNSGIASMNPDTYPLSLKPARKRRSDAGKPKAKKLTASVTLGVQFDLSTDEGRKCFADTLRFWIDQGEREQVVGVVEKLMRELEKRKAEQ